MTDARLKETIERIRENIKTMKQQKVHFDPTADVVVALYDHIVQLEDEIRKIHSRVI